MAVAAATTRRPRPVPLTLASIGRVIFGGDAEQIRFLQQKNLLASSRACSCGIPMTLGKKNDISDKHIWR